MINAVRALTVGVALFGLSASAQAGILYNDLAVSGNNNFLTIAPENPAGAMFMTDGSGTIGDIQLMLGGDPTNIGGAIEVTIWTDEGNDFPTNEVGGPIGTIADTAMNPSGLFTVQDVPSSITGLSPNTPYWVVLFDDSASPATDPGSVYGGTSIVWQTAANDSGTGVAGESYFTNSTVFPNSDQADFGPAQMCISSIGGGSCASVRSVSTPEPATLALLGFGIIGLAALRRRATSRHHP